MGKQIRMDGRTSSVLEVLITTKNMGMDIFTIELVKRLSIFKKQLIEKHLSIDSFEKLRFSPSAYSINFQFSCQGWEIYDNLFSSLNIGS